MKNTLQSIGLSVLTGLGMATSYVLWERYVSSHGPSAAAPLDVFYWTAAGAFIARMTMDPSVSVTVMGREFTMRDGDKITIHSVPREEQDVQC